MKYIKDLSHFIKKLEAAGELKRIKVPVDSDLEISEIYFRHARSPGGGRALLFENVENSTMPVLINSLGSHRRVSIAFGERTMDEIAASIRKLLKLVQFKKPSNLSEIISLFSSVIYVLRIPPGKKRFGKGRCQEIVYTGDEIDLGILPVIKSWPGDAGKFITLPLVFTRSLKDGSTNVGMYRMQILDRRTTAMHWQIHKDGSNFHSEYRKAGRRMPVSVAVGSDPAVVFSAIAPMPPKMNELMMAGFIRGRGVRMVKCITNDLYVPENAEIILEGYVDPFETADEGPFGDHTGYYTPVEKFPVFHVTAVTMKKNPVYMTTVVGRSPQEDCYLAYATERIFLPLFQMLAPEVTDQMLPWDGCFHNCAVISIKKEFPYQARKLMNHLWGFSQMSFAKSLIITDDGVNLSGGENLTRHILDNLDLSRDVIISKGILDQLDHSGIAPLYGGKIGLDVTKKIPGEDASGIKKHAAGKKSREHLEKYLMQLKRKSVLAADCRLYGEKLRNPVFIVSVNKKKNQGKLAKKVSDALKLSGNGVFPFTVVLVLEGRDRIQDNSTVLWKIFGNVDPVRDVLRVENSSSPDGIIYVVDATDKNTNDGYDRVWPEENLMDDKTIEKVDLKWEEMFGEKSFKTARP